jgi:hypothetical protein
MFNDFEIIKPTTTGLLPEPVRDPRDYVLGAISSQGVVRDRPVLMKTGHGWKDFAPSNDYQRLADGDSNGCVSFSSVNAIQYSVNVESDNAKKVYLNQEQYINDYGNFEANNRIVVVGSGTDPNTGNSVTAVAEFIRKNGLAPMSAWPWNNQMTRNEFYNGGTVPPGITEKGEPLLKLFTIEHEWVPTDKSSNPFCQYCSPEQLIEALKYGTPTVSVDGNYERDENGLICGRQSAEGKLYNWNHRITLVDFSPGEWWECHDHYNNQFIKFAYEYRFGNPKCYFVLENKKYPMMYKQKGSPALYIKHWAQDLLIPFGAGKLEGGDLWKSLYSVENYSDIPRIDCEVLPFPVADFAIKTE